MAKLKIRYLDILQESLINRNNQQPKNVGHAVGHADS